MTNAGRTHQEAVGAQRESLGVGRGIGVSDSLKALNAVCESPCHCQGYPECCGEVWRP